MQNATTSTSTSSTSSTSSSTILSSPTTTTSSFSFPSSGDSTTSSSSSTISSTNSNANEVIITYWPWMRIMGILEDSRLEKISWAEAKEAWVTDPRPYENLHARAPRMVTGPALAATPAATPNIMSISYGVTPVVDEPKWPWDLMMWMKEQLRLNTMAVSWAEARYYWLTGPLENTVGEL